MCALASEQHAPSLISSNALTKRSAITGRVVGRCVGSTLGELALPSGAVGSPRAASSCASSSMDQAASLGSRVGTIVLGASGWLVANRRSCKRCSITPTHAAPVISSGHLIRPTP